jgi:hypothetical protein
MQQQTLMRFDPATGEPKPYPSHAQQWREWHGFGTAWLFNPWTGGRRNAGDVGTDVMGQLIQPPVEAMYAAQSANNLCGQQQSQGGMVLGGAIHGLGQMLAEQRQSRITPVPHG